MDRNEAIKEVRSFIGQLTEGCQEAIRALVPELRESEDERIWKAIDEIMNLDKAWEIAGKHGLTAADIRRWVKKQKEQKPGEQVDPADASWDAYYQRGLNKGYDLGVEAGRKEQKPAEWSEEEKKTISFVIDVLRANHPDGFFKTSPAGDIHVTGITVEKLIKKLESLLSRPKLSDNWKPTEEQLHALYLASYGGELSSEDCLELDSLLIDLKKLYSL